MTHRAHPWTGMRDETADDAVDGIVIRRPVPSLDPDVVTGRAIEVVCRGALCEGRAPGRVSTAQAGAARPSFRTKLRRIECGGRCGPALESTNNYRGLIQNRS